MRPVSIRDEFEILRFPAVIDDDKALHDEPGSEARREIGEEIARIEECVAREPGEPVEKRFRRFQAVAAFECCSLYG